MEWWYSIGECLVDELRAVIIAPLDEVFAVEPKICETIVMTELAPRKVDL